MAIYADVLILENFIVNLFLLTLTMKSVKHRCSMIRLIISSLIGGIYTLVLLIPKLNLLASLPCAILVACSMIRIIYGRTSIFNLLKLLGIFLMITFTLSGLCFVFSLQQNIYVLGSAFKIGKYSIKYIILGIMIIYIIYIRIIEYAKERLFVKNYIFSIEFNIGEKKYSLESFLDTGNELREPITNLPCILIEDNFIKDINFNNSNTYYIPYTSIGFGGNLKGIRVDKIKIKGNDFSRDEIDAIICPCKEKLSKENEFNALLSRGVV